MPVYELEWALYKVCNSVTNGGAEPDAAQSGRAAPDCNVVIILSVFRSLRLGLLNPSPKPLSKELGPCVCQEQGMRCRFKATREEAFLVSLQCLQQIEMQL